MFGLPEVVLNFSLIKTLTIKVFRKVSFWVLFNLSTGSLLLDINETDPSQIFHCMVDDLAKSGQIPDSAKTDVMRALLYEHK